MRLLDKPPPIAPLKVALKVPLLAVWIVVGAATMLVARTFDLDLRHTFPQRFHGLVCRLFGLRTESRGEAADHALYVVNHTSYLDVFVLGAVLRGSFVAKSEVSGWPVFGKLARLQNTVFLERNPRRAASQVDTVREHLARTSLILFPEGTSSVGTDVLPFRSSLFAGVEEALVQPVTIAYRTYDGAPMTSPARERYAWYLPNPTDPTPNQSFVSHFLSAMGLRQCQVTVILHEPVEPGRFETRKQCAQHCEQAVRRGLRQELGRP